MYNHLLYFSYWIVNSFVLSLFHFVLSQDVILGNSKLTALDASIYSGFWITFVVWIFWDFLLAKKYEWGRVKTFFWFWLANSLGVWLVAHVGGFTGLGISSFYVAIIVGFLINIFQRGIRRFITKNI